MPVTFKEAVHTLLQDPASSKAMEDSYLSGPPVEMGLAFSRSEEFTATIELAKRFCNKARTLADVGAGSGFASLAWASRGLSVTAIEPSDCDEFGFKAFSSLAAITSVKGSIYDLPLPSQSVDIAYTRQVLHHVEDLPRAAQEVARILRPSGIWIAVREHVVSDSEQLTQFLAGHPIHQLCQNEHAYTLPEYTTSLSGPFTIARILKPFDSVINHFPISNSEVRGWLTRSLMRIFPSYLSNSLASIGIVEKLYRHRLSIRCTIPGRMYSFALRKP